MFADNFTIKLGDVTLKGRRLSIKEIRAYHSDAESGSLDIEKSVELIRKHVTLGDGGKFDPYDLTPGQLRQLVGELILPKDGRSLSDFIGLVS